MARIGGHPYGERLEGGRDPDSITGGGGQDTIYGGGGNDTLIGADDVDVLTGESGNDSLRGLDGDDYLEGGNGKDSLDGGDGNDRFDGGAGNDSIYGGAGVDVASYIFYAATKAVQLDFSLLDPTRNVVVGDGRGGKDTLRGVESVYISDTNFSDHIVGSGGGDLIFTGGTGDTAFRASHDTVFGGAGNDTISSWSTAVLTLDAGDGDDSISASSFYEDGPVSDIRIAGGDGNDTLGYLWERGPKGIVLSTDAQGNVTVVLKGQAGGLTATGIEHLAFTASQQNDIVSGLRDADTLNGSYGDDLIDALGGNDRVVGGHGADTLRGGDGDDTIEGGFGNDRIGSGDGNDMIHTGYGRDTVDAGSGNDIVFLEGVGGSAKGGKGFDTLVALASELDLSGSGIDGAITLDGAVYTLSGFEVAEIRGTLSADTLTGSGFDDTLRGSFGRDVLDGGGGDDLILQTAFGLDYQTDEFAEPLAERGDTIHGGAGIDTIDYTPEREDDGESHDWDIDSIGDLIVRLDLGTAESRGIGRQKIDGIEVVLGASGNDSIVGAKAAETLSGGFGNDTLVGGRGRDSLDGGPGDDLIVAMLHSTEKGDTVAGGKGFDGIDYAKARAALTVRLDLGTASSAEIGVQVLSGIESVKGGLGDDTITGSAGDDVLIGGGGADRIAGGKGIDRLQGHSGADTFAFAGGDTSASVGKRDFIVFFSQSDGDRVDLSAIDAVKGGADDVFRFIGSGAFTKAAGELRAVLIDGQTVVAGDVNGNGKADFAIQIGNAVTLVEGDYVL